MARIPKTSRGSSTGAASARATSHLPRITSDQESTLVDLFASEIEAQLEGRSDLEEKWDRWERCYKAEPKVARKEYPWPNASNLVVGLTPIYVDSLAARIMQGIFGVEPHWTVQEINKEWADVANPYERYLEWQRTHTWNQYKIVKCMVLDCLKLGTGILHTPWVDKPLFEYNATNNKMEPVGRLTGPAPVWVPRRNFLIPDGYSDIQTAPWIAMRQWYNRQEMRQFDFLKQIENFDKIKDVVDDDMDALTNARDGAPIVEPRSDELAPIAVWQVWCNHDLDGDGYAEPLILLIHPKTKALLRIMPNTIAQGRRMFVAAQFIEQEGKFDGIPVPAMVEQYDDEVTTIHNQRRDNSHLANTSMAVARKGSGVNKTERFFPGRIFLVNGDPKSEITEFGIGRVNPITVQEEQLTIGYAERRVGLSDMNLGQMSSPMGRAAATTMMSVLQEGKGRNDLSTSEIRRALTEHGLQITELYKAHGLPAADQPESPEQILDEQDAALVRKLFTATDPIRGMIALQLNVATAALNRETEKQSSLQLLGVVTQYFQGVIATWPQISPLLMDPNAPPPIKQAIMSMVGGIDRAMRGVLQAHQRYDLEGILIADMLGELAAAPPQGPQPMQPGGMNGGGTTGLPGGLAAPTQPGQGADGGIPGALALGGGGNGGPAGP